MATPSPACDSLQQGTVLLQIFLILRGIQLALKYAIENGMKEFAVRKLLRLCPLEQLPLLPVMFRDRHICCWNGRIQVTS